MITRRNPDLAIVFQGDTERRARGPASSASGRRGGLCGRRRARLPGEKRQEYLVFGIREFWIVGSLRSGK